MSVKSSIFSNHNQVISYGIKIETSRLFASLPDLDLKYLDVLSFNNVFYVLFD